MPSERRIDSDHRRFLVANFADHDLVWVVAQNRTEAASEVKTLLLIYRNLRDARNLVFDLVFDRYDFVLDVLDLIDSRVERSGLAGTGGTGDENHAIRLANIV